MALSASTVWEVRTTGSDTNGGGFVTGSGGTDYSQQDAAQLSVTDAACTGNTTLTSATGGFTSTMIGSIVYLSSGPGWYEITARTDTNTVTIDRNGPNATGMTANVGGALATPGVAVSLMTVTGMTGWIKAGTYTVGTGISWPSNGTGYTAINSLTGYTTSRGDRSTKPVIRATAAITLFTLGQFGCYLINLDLDGDSTGTNGVTATSAYNGIVECTVRDFLNYGIAIGSCIADRCEISGCGGASDGCALLMNLSSSVVTNCYVHDNTTTGIKINQAQEGGVVIGCVIESNSGGSSDGIFGTYRNTIYGCVLYGNGRDGMRFPNNFAAIQQGVRNNIFDSNAGYGINFTSAFVNGPYALPVINYNAFRNNTSGARNNVSAGTGDVTLSADPFTNAASGDFSLNTTAGGGAACRAAGFPGVFPGGLTTGYLDIGAAQHQDSGGSGGGIILCL